MRGLLLMLLLQLPLTQAWAQKPIAPPAIDGVTTLAAEEAVMLALNDPALVIIDSRKDEVYAKGHIDGAVSLLDSRMSLSVLEQYAANKNTPILFYCNGIRCLRSSNALKKVLKWGYHNLYWFRGGWVEWQEKKLPIAK